MTKYLLKSTIQVLNNFFATDMDVISKECKKTLANPVSRGNYKRCINDMRKHNISENTFVDYNAETKTIVKF